MYKYRVLTTIGIYILTFNGLKGQSKQRDNLDSTTVKFETSISVDDYNYDGLANTISTKAKIIGLGEGTHGTHEFFTIKELLVKNLVNKGYKNFVLEAGYVECIELNKYINNVDLSIDSLLVRLMPWPWACKEFKEMLDWMRDYNQLRKSEDKIHFYGMDICGTQLLNKNSSGFYGDKQESSIIKEALEIYNNKDISGKHKLQLISKLQKRYEISTDKNSDEYFITVNILESVYTWTLKGGKLRKDRERKLFEMVKRIEAWLPTNAKFILWGHNEHITQKSNNRKSLGYFLNKEYKDQYQTIGFDFNSGSFCATDIDSLNFGKKVFGKEFSREATPETFANKINNLNKGIFFIDFTLKQNKRKLCATRWYIQSIGAAYGYKLATNKPKLYLQKVNLCKAFNYLFIVKKTSPSHLLFKERE